MKILFNISLVILKSYHRYWAKGCHHDRTASTPHTYIYKFMFLYIGGKGHHYVTQMKSAVSFLVFLLTLLLVLTVSPLSHTTTQVLVFHFLFPLFSTPPSQQVFSLQTGKTPILYLFSNRKLLLHPLQTITQSLYFLSQDLGTSHL